MIELYFFILGASLASFLGLVIDRFPHRSIIRPGSHCEACGHRLAWRDLVPIFSLIINRFRCRFCQQKISPFYSLFELVLATFFYLYSLGSLSFSQLLLLTLGLVLAIYDFKSLSYPFLVWLFFQLPLLFVTSLNPLTLVFLCLGLLAYFFPLGIGTGDFFLLASYSLIFSLLQILWLIQIASCLGFVYFFLQRKRDRIPFVPCLFLASFLLIFSGQLLAG
ncbi:prepilin peptidase [Streptococcus oricebi]|uniref:Prepilin peptidase n=1 Tax=Streptococcus oricebi TaxID=1547447 RepID=A0ABS5B1M9_9STRE|nr:A24 family peptidase [Streptococcus oricebi]MBP2622741.1 prepilin peptidase [Streptococcus oricebi]